GRVHRLRRLRARVPGDRNFSRRGRARESETVRREKPRGISEREPAGKAATQLSDRTRSLSSRARRGICSSPQDDKNLALIQNAAASPAYCAKVDTSLRSASRQSCSPFATSFGGRGSQRGVRRLYSTYSLPKIDSSTPSS